MKRRRREKELFDAAALQAIVDEKSSKQFGEQEKEKNMEI